MPARRAAASRQPRSDPGRNPSTPELGPPHTADREEGLGHHASGSVSRENGDKLVYLHVTVQNLDPGHSYSLERATVTTV
jgi:hypothetical protein